MAKDIDPDRLTACTRPKGLPFNITKIGHVVLNCTDLERSVRFYTEILGFQVSDVYGADIAPGGMVFLRCNPDHHGVALVGSLPETSHNVELNHLAFEVGTLDEVLRAREHLQRHGIVIDFEGRRRAGVQIAVEFRDPDGHLLEIYWGLDRIGSDGHVRPPAEWIWAHSLEEAIANPVRGQDTTVQDTSLLRQRSAAEIADITEKSLQTHRPSWPCAHRAIDRARAAHCWACGCAGGAASGSEWRNGSLLRPSVAPASNSAAM